MTPRIVLFDIDGTLLLSGGAGARALNTLFRRRYAVDNAFAGIRPHGMTDPAIFRQMIRNQLDRDPQPGELETLADDYVVELASELENPHGLRIMPGVPDVLEALAARQEVVLGLATGNIARASTLKLRSAGLDGYFAFGGFGCDSEDRSVLTARARERGHEVAGDAAAPAFVIGDTIHDVHAGRNAGAGCVGLLTTGTRREDFQAAGADLVIEDLRDHEALLGFLDL